MGVHNNKTPHVTWCQLWTHWDRCPVSTHAPVYISCWLALNNIHIFWQRRTCSVSCWQSNIPDKPVPKCQTGLRSIPEALYPTSAEKCPLLFEIEPFNDWHTSLSKSVPRRLEWHFQVNNGLVAILWQILQLHPCHNSSENTAIVSQSQPDEGTEHVQQIIGWAILGTRKVWHTLWWDPTTTLTHKSCSDACHLAAGAQKMALWVGNLPSKQAKASETCSDCLQPRTWAKQQRPQRLKVPQFSFMGGRFKRPHLLADHFLVLQVAPRCWACHDHQANLAQPQQPCSQRAVQNADFPNMHLVHFGTRIVSLRWLLQHQPPARLWGLTTCPRKTCLYAALEAT